MSNEITSYQRERLFIDNDINIDYTATDNMRTRFISFDKFEDTNNLQRNDERNFANIDDDCLSNKKK